MTRADRRGRTLVEADLGLPADGYHLWEWFGQLDRSRGFVDGCVLAIPYQEIVAWSSLLRVSVRPWEVDVLVSMDRTRVRIWNSTRPQPGAKHGEPENLVSFNDADGIKMLFRAHARASAEAATAATEG